jgi:tetratricopeptide (TPR) repeat protein
MKAFLGANRFSLAMVALVVFGLGSRPSLAADSLAAGRKHAAKANQLASKNKCKNAVVEFTKAYATLKDATILFNRAECQRKLGNHADALMDYELFLSEMPTAPNRASVETRIASLRAAVKAESAAVPVVPVAPVAPGLPSTVVASPPEKPSQPPAVEAAKPTDKVPEAPVHRAEKWTD